MKALTYIEHSKFALLDKPNAIATVGALYDEAQTLPDPNTSAASAVSAALPAIRLRSAPPGFFQISSVSSATKSPSCRAT